MSRSDNGTFTEDKTPIYTGANYDYTTTFCIGHLINNWQPCFYTMYPKFQTVGAIKEGVYELLLIHTVESGYLAHFVIWRTSSIRRMSYSCLNSITIWRPQSN